MNKYIFTIEVKDELGIHVLQSNRDCVWVCPECKKERKVTIKHLVEDNKPISPQCKCGNMMEFHYWLDLIEE